MMVRFLLIIFYMSCCCFSNSSLNTVLISSAIPPLFNVVFKFVSFCSYIYFGSFIVTYCFWIASFLGFIYGWLEQVPKSYCGTLHVSCIQIFPAVSLFENQICKQKNFLYRNEVLLKLRHYCNFWLKYIKITK